MYKTYFYCSSVDGMLCYFMQENKIDDACFFLLDGLLYHLVLFLFYYTDALYFVIVCM